MNDLPTFLQMFVRVFVIIAAGAWMSTAPDDDKQEAASAVPAPVHEQSQSDKKDASKAETPPPAACHATEASAPASK